MRSYLGVVTVTGFCIPFSITNEVKMQNIDQIITNRYQAWEIDIATGMMSNPTKEAACRVQSSSSYTLTRNKTTKVLRIRGHRFAGFLFTISLHKTNILAETYKNVDQLRYPRRYKLHLDNLQEKPNKTNAPMNRPVRSIAPPFALARKVNVQWCSSRHTSSCRRITQQEFANHLRSANSLLCRFPGFQTF